MKQVWLRHSGGGAAISSCILSSPAAVEYLQMASLGQPQPVLQGRPGIRQAPNAGFAKSGRPREASGSRPKHARSAERVRSERTRACVRQRRRRTRARTSTVWSAILCTARACTDTLCGAARAETSARVLAEHTRMHETQAAGSWPRMAPTLRTSRRLLRNCAHSGTCSQPVMFPLALKRLRRRRLSAWRWRVVACCHVLSGRVLDPEECTCGRAETKGDGRAV